jgi:hypothetical protein
MLAQAHQLAAQIAMLDRSLDSQRELVQLERLAQKVVSARTHRCNCLLEAAERGHHDDRHVPVSRLDSLGELETTYPGHLKVGYHHRNVSRAEQSERFGRVVYGKGRIAPAAEIAGDQGRKIDVVFDDENGLSGRVHRLLSSAIERLDAKRDGRRASS